MDEKATKSWTFKAEEIFEDIPTDPENCLMKLPEEICKEIGLVPGDLVKVLWGDQGTIIIEKVKETNGEE
jgi:hypothetical protein